MRRVSTGVGSESGNDAVFRPHRVCDQAFSIGTSCRLLLERRARNVPSLPFRGITHGEGLVTAARMSSGECPAGKAGGANPPSRRNSLKLRGSALPKRAVD